MTDHPQPENDPAAAPLSEAERERIVRKLDKLYDLLPKIIARIRSDEPQEAETALRVLLRCFKDINKLETQIRDPKDDFVPWSLSRLYELASAAPATHLAEENKALLDLAESLEFQIKTMRVQAADELLKTGQLSPVPMTEIKAGVDSLTALLDRFEALSPQPAPAASGKPLDERLAEELAGMTDISLKDLAFRLRMDQKPGPVGKFLRNKGFMYDPADLTAARQLVMAMVRANKKLAAATEDLLPARAQMENIQSLLGLIELHAGLGEREGPQYQDAMAEIERLKRSMERLETAKGTQEELDRLVAEAEQSLSSVRAEIADLESRKDEILETVRLISQENEELREALSRTERDLTEKNKELADALSAANKKCREAEGNIDTLKQRIKTIEGGLLLGRLEMEIFGLRAQLLAREEMDAARELQQQALESRIVNWVKNEDETTGELKKLRAKDMFNRATLGTVGGIALAGGYVTAGFIQTMTAGAASPMLVYFSTISAPLAVLGAFIGFSDSHDERLKGVLLGALGGSVAGGILGLLGAIPMLGTIETYAPFKDGACTSSPCVVVKGDDGENKVEVLSKKFAGKKMVLDFSDRKNPVIYEAPAAAVPSAPAP